MTAPRDLELVATVRAHERYRAYQRRWRVGDNCTFWFWAEAYIRRMRVLEQRRYEPPLIIPVGNLNDLLRDLH